MNFPTWWNPPPATARPKPRLRRLPAANGGHVWVCEDGEITGHGWTPVAAWSHWRGRRHVDAMMREATRC